MAKIIAIKWLVSNIGLVTTATILLEMLFGITNNHSIKFRFLDNTVRMDILSLRTDIAMLTEIFCFEAYEIKEDIKPTLIVDAGANKGTTSIYFGIKYPVAEIHCYEPNSDLIAILRNHLKINGVNARVYNEAISDMNGIKFFEKNENHQFSKIVEEDCGLSVRSVSLNDRYVNKKIDILKLDIEGEEEKVIDSIDFKNLDIGVIIQEVHYDRVDYEKIFSILRKNDYYFSDPYPQYHYLNPDVDRPILLAITKL